MKKIFILSTLLLAIYGCDNPTESNEETIVGTWKEARFQCNGSGTNWSASDCADTCEPDDCEHNDDYEYSDYWTFFNDGLLAITDNGTTSTATYSYTIEDGVLHYIDLNTGGDATWRYYIVNNNSEMRFTHLSNSTIYKTFSRE